MFQLYLNLSNGIKFQLFQLSISKIPIITGRHCNKEVNVDTQYKSQFIQKDELIFSQ